ncbi:MAG: HPr family phosphocarrier protein [Planctomycetaceae bacterium]
MSSDEVLTREVVVNLPAGLHLRPISRIARLAVNSMSELTVKKGGLTANAKSPLELMSLAAGAGETLTLEARGDDAADLLDAIAGFFDVDSVSDADANGD